MEFIFEKLRHSSKPIVLYGMGNGADLIISRLAHYGIKPAGIFASNDFVRSKHFHNMPITDYKTAKKEFGPMIVLLCFGTDRPDVMENIEKIATENEFYIPDVPVFGNDFFDRNYYETNKPVIQQVENMLADEASRSCFRELIRFKADGNRRHLISCESDPEIAEQEILNYGSNEDYLDIGAYNGDTVLSFAENVNYRYKHIYAIEPFEKNFKKLCENTAHLKNITHINKACSDSTAPLLFSNKGGRGSGIGKQINIPAFTADSFFSEADRSVSTIKIDVEGLERQTISGAEKTILRYKPKLKIAAYHRTGDLWDIPLQIQRIRPDYNIYLRHFPCYPAWDTNYYFV